MARCAKWERLLNLYERLNSGELVNKRAYADEFGVSDKAVQRDIDDIRAYLADKYSFGDKYDVVYNKKQNGYALIGSSDDRLTKEEVLGIAKIILESRALNKNELDGIMKKLKALAPNDAKKQINAIVDNEKHHYVPPRHGKYLLDLIWEISGYIYNARIISFDYTRQDGTRVNRTVEPYAIMFSEYYFYLIAKVPEQKDRDYPIAFRVDRMENIEGKEHYKVIDSKRFEDGDFRKYVQFMYSGPKKRIEFEFSGPSLEAILDRIPTAKVIKRDDENKVYTISAESYGDGILMWLKTQGENVKILDIN